MSSQMEEKEKEFHHQFQELLSKFSKTFFYIINHSVFLN